MTCHVILELTVKEGCYDSLRKWFVDSMPSTRDFDGYVSAEFVRNQDDLTKLLIMERWETRQHHERYLAWRVESGTLEELGAMIDGEPQIRYFDPIGVSR